MWWIRLERGFIQTIILFLNVSPISQWQEASTEEIFSSEKKPHKKKYENKQT